MTRKHVPDTSGLTTGADRCTERVPERLCGGLKGDQRPRCRKVNEHKKHHAERHLPGVGKTIWEWKGSELEARVPPKSAFAEPEIIIKQYAPKESVGKCGCAGMFHKCRLYKGLVRL